MKDKDVTQSEFRSKNPSKSIDRVTLGNAEAARLNKWTDELNKRADGLIRFTKADVVNFLIANHDESLAVEEVRAISAICYDEAKWLGWGLIKLKAAKRLGAALSFNDLIQFRDELLARVPVKAKALKRKSSPDPALALGESKGLLKADAEGISGD